MMSALPRTSASAILTQASTLNACQIATLTSDPVAVARLLGERKAHSCGLRIGHVLCRTSRSTSGAKVPCSAVSRWASSGPWVSLPTCPAPTCPTTPLLLSDAHSCCPPPQHDSVRDIALAVGVLTYTAIGVAEHHYRHRHMTLERERALAAAVAPVVIATAVPPTPCKVVLPSA